MKLTKIIVMLGLLVGGANAATVAVSKGFGAQGFTVLVNSVAPTNYYWAVGNYDTGTSTWTQFGTATLNQVSTNPKVNGSITSTSPSSLNSSILELFVGTGNSIANSGSNWVILKMNSNLTFPADVSVGGTTTFLATVSNGVTFVAKGATGSGFDTVGASGANLNLVPEPSAALLGAFGVLGLLRRRRN